MKRYLVFCGSNYYPSGGWDDFVGERDTMEDARALAGEKSPNPDSEWWHIVDTTTQEIIYE